MIAKPRRGLFVYGLVLCALVSGIGGNYLRDRAEAGTNVGLKQFTDVSRLLASREKGLDISEAEFFYRLSELVKDHYVDPIKSDMKLATGAVRGMILSLNDPHAQYMTKEEFKGFEDAKKGIFHGIGVELEYIYNPEFLKQLERTKRPVEPTAIYPDVVVRTVVPGSPSDKAGLKPGDRIDGVDGRWVMNLGVLLEFRDLQIKVDQKKASIEDLKKLRLEIRDKRQKAISPSRAKKLLCSRDKELVRVRWIRSGKKFEAALERQVSQLAPILPQPDGSIRLNFIEGAAKTLATRTANQKPLVIDLRNTPTGAMDEMVRCLELLAPAGEYGLIRTSKKSKAQSFRLARGNSMPIPLTLITDRSTSGLAEIFALVLREKNLAKPIEGTMRNERVIVASHKLPDGSGFTLPIGVFEPKKSPTEPSTKEVKR